MLQRFWKIISKEFCIHPFPCQQTLFFLCSLGHTTGVSVETSNLAKSNTLSKIEKILHCANSHSRCLVSCTPAKIKFRAKILKRVPCCRGMMQKHVSRGKRRGLRLKHIAVGCVLQFKPQVSWRLSAAQIQHSEELVWTKFERSKMYFAHNFVPKTELTEKSWRNFGHGSIQSKRIPTKRFFRRLWGLNFATPLSWSQLKSSV